ncbi:hypothetical protein [Actinoplanes derwentensis]|uniref:Uncharacterized protein n=1 Tax=Actinoplanes derwentensis TaxID=113562 RepID=A0A1H1Y5U5_9ACTN|nr:hypothetical protein [Actinoplanes derwentensis]GID86711.1 hypothetical protein Ade03nite_56350 [Actinoplanes derwentensis]SDT16771.1 hypothetical protein SAMN04489716_2717 [Actinoplanes derwentensis]
MLPSVEITTVLELAEAPFHNLHWTKKIELSLDCFVCRRNGRTTMLEYGSEEGICSGDSAFPRHPAAARISAFDVTSEETRTTLRVVAEHWWAPFDDTKHQQPSVALTSAPWVRLYLGYLCPAPGSAGGKFSTQTNLVRPSSYRCDQCGETLARSDEAPRLRLLP